MGIETAGDPLSEIDAMVMAGQLAEAADALDELTAAGPGSFAAWMRLAGLRRALRQPQRALAAVNHALGFAPLDFAALVLRAGLLEALGDRGAGLAWDHALAQRPAGSLPPPLASAVAAGEQCRARWARARADGLDAALAKVSPALSDDERWRLRRFRSNVLRETRAWHSQPTHFHFPGLSEREFHPRARFPWLDALERTTPAIRAEMLALMRSSRVELVPYVQYPEHEALAQWRPLNHSLDWTAIHLINCGETIDPNAGKCPQTMAALAALDQPDIAGASPNAMFSLLAPGAKIPPHVGVSNARLVCHLPLVVPPGCWFRVGAETREWREGEAFVFDDTIEHEAQNPSELLRVVLIFDVWHPDLTAAEREGVAAVISHETRGGGGL